jgi:hypothetical protein
VFVKCTLICLVWKDAGFGVSCLLYWKKSCVLGLKLHVHKMYVSCLFIHDG